MCIASKEIFAEEVECYQEIIHISSIIFKSVQDVEEVCVGGGEGGDSQK